ncbi:anti-sigma factor [Catenulispora rubra]|uniref:anti-sigma factor n=1 Tax=Catenulispora rubra TaxID=280293 RepID=UPI001891FCCD|nr:anti-sigma factor [Catenulispora rubra]
MDPEVHSLTGAYVCHALEPAEREAFERHLAQCPTCVQEVAELQETAALLASAAAETPPARLKAAVDAQIAVTRQIPPLVAHGPADRPAAARQTAARPRRRWFTALGWGVATGLAVAVAVLGVRVGDQQNQIDQANQRSTAISTLLSAPDAHADSVNVSTGGTGMVLVSRSRDEAAITINGLAKLEPGKAYQLWMMGPSGTRSGGVLPAGAQASGSVLAHGLGDAQTIGLTVEPAGGSAQPTTTPIMLLPMPA